jgi:hypothetical protein
VAARQRLVAGAAGVLEQWLDRTLTNACGTDEASQQRYRDTMTAAGFDVTEATFEYTDDLDLGQLVGSLYSAMPVPPRDQRTAFAEQIRRAVAPHERFTEPVLVRMLLGRPRQIGRGLGSPDTGGPLAASVGSGMHSQLVHRKTEAIGAWLRRPALGGAGRGRSTAGTSRPRHERTAAQGRRRGRARWPLPIAHARVPARPDGPGL